MAATIPAPTETWEDTSVPVILLGNTDTDIYNNSSFYLGFSIRCNVDGETAGFLPMEKRMKMILFHLFLAAMVVLVLIFFCRCCCCNKKALTAPQPLPPAHPQQARRQRKPKASRIVIIILFVILLQIILFFMDGPGSRF